MARSQPDIKTILDKAFRNEFPKDTVDISDGYQKNIHVLIVSRRFDSMNEQEKTDCLCTIIDRTNLSDDEKRLISLTLALSPAEIK